MSIPLRPYAVMFTIALMAMIALPSYSLAATYSVPGNYPTIGAAIANASDGDTITVDSGTYHENVHISKKLTLLGYGWPLIDIASGAGIDISADNVIVQGFRITHAGTGINVHDCGSASVVDNAVIENGYGIMLTNVHGSTIMNNTIAGNHNNGIYLGDSNGNALYLNKVTNNNYGISVTGSSASNVIYMNALEDNSGANGLANGLWNNWNSSIPITYGYGGRQYSNYLGNYWGNLKGSDNNNDGIMDSSIMLAENSGDHNPLVEAPLDRPLADFTSDSTSGIAPLPIQFTDRSKDYTVSWHWDFGDGSVSDMLNPPHVYAKPGQYTVSLTVKNLHGQDTMIKSNYIVVSLTSSPTAGASITPYPVTPTATPEPWPTATPTTAPMDTHTPTPSAKPSPGMGWALAITAAGIALLLANKKGR